MTKISTLFYLVDNSNNEENVEIAGKLLEMEYSDLLNSLKENSMEPSEELITKIISLSRNS